MRRSFKAFKFFHRPLSRICALPVDRNDWQRKRATSKQLWPGLIVQADAKHRPFDVMGLLTQHNTRWTLSNYKENQIVYAQGDPADSVFYIHRGKVKVTVISKLGKEAVVAIRGPDEFCGEGAMPCICLHDQPPPRLFACGALSLPIVPVYRQRANTK